MPDLKRKLKLWWHRAAERYWTFVSWERRGLGLEKAALRADMKRATHLVILVGVHMEELGIAMSDLGVKATRATHAFHALAREIGSHA